MMNPLYSFAFLLMLADDNTYFYIQAMQQPDCAAFIQAMVKKVDDLFDTGVWRLRKQSELGIIKPIKAIRSFKRKRLPDDTITRHKARICAHGGVQIGVVHFWDTYPTVVQMTTVLLLLILTNNSNCLNHTYSNGI
jgi:hypothetical protein